MSGANMRIVVRRVLTSCFIVLLFDPNHRRSENDFIGGLPDSQLYAVFAMANCGRDLESYQLTGYEQVRSMMLQVCD